MDNSESINSQYVGGMANGSSHRISLTIDHKNPVRRLNKKDKSEKKRQPV